MNYTKDQFLASVSHEIRTPIQTIIGTTELLADTQLDAEQSEYVRQMRFSADILLALVNDILDFSKLESGKVTLERISFNLITQIEQTVDLLTMEAHSRGLEIIVDIDPAVPEYVSGDPNKFRQILLNLVKNAVKFTERGYILVAALPEVSEGKTFVRFEVSDTGIGIDDKSKESIFSQFSQGDISISRTFGGTGLGLSIAKDLTELMGGKIGVADNRPVGTVFWFTLPVEDSEKLQLLQSCRESSFLHIPFDTSFLLVDDCALALGSLRKMLESLGYHAVSEAGSGEEALDLMIKRAEQGTPFSIVFIDMIMPGLGGWRLAAEITNNHRINAAQLFLMLPEGANSRDTKMNLLPWFNGYLYKPVKRMMLFQLLKDSCNPAIDLEAVPADTPLSEDAAPERAACPETNTRSIRERIRIIVADDHPVNQKLLKAFLEKMDAVVMTADNGTDVVKVFKNSTVPPDIIFMDIHMPVLNGTEASHILRQLGYTGIIIACTANNQAEEFSGYFDAGMNDVLLKPFKKSELQEILNKWKVIIPD